MASLLDSPQQVSRQGPLLPTGFFPANRLLRKVLIQSMLMRQIVRDRPVHTLQRFEHREGLQDAFRGGALPELVDDGVQGDTGAGHVITAGAPFDVVVEHLLRVYRAALGAIIPSLAHS